MSLTGCADLPEAHLHGEVIYLGDRDREAVDVPAQASPLVEPCLGNSIVSRASDFLGIGKVDERITPPFYIGLWPVAATEEDEQHGRHDSVSVGLPQPGDNPFLKHVVCTAGKFDWNIGEVLEGEYYIGVWLDLDFTGFPKEDEPMGFYRGDDGTEDYDPAQVDPVPVLFEGEPVMVRLQVGTPRGSRAEQLDDILVRLERAIQEDDRQLFRNQFHPLYYRDEFNRTFNELDEIWTPLVTSIFPLQTEVSWFSDGIARIAQEKNPEAGFWDLNEHVEYRTKLSFRDWRDDGIYQITEWRPHWVLSGELKVDGAVPPDAFEEDTEHLDFFMAFPAPMTTWVGLEQFVASVTGDTGGMWEPATAPSNNPRICVFDELSSNVDIRLTANSSGMGCTVQDVDFAAATAMRLTVIPMHDDPEKGRYAEWDGYPAQMTEPERGNFARFYFYNRAHPGEE